MSHVPGGLVYKRFLNALRPVGVPPVPPPFVCGDGPVWTSINSATPLGGNISQSQLSIAKGATRFVRAGVDNGSVNTARFRYSDDDGLTWTDGPNVATGGPNLAFNYSNALIYGNGIFFQRVYNFGYLRSLDEGLTFTYRDTAFGATIRSGFNTFCGGKFWLLGATVATYTVDASTNASFVNATINSLVGDIVSIYEWNGDLYLITAPTTPTPNSGRLYVSTDGGNTFNWTGVFQPWASTVNAPMIIAVGNNSRAGIGINSDLNGTAFYTLNGQNWLASAGTGGLPYQNKCTITYQQGAYLLMASGNEFPLVSVDQGATFSASPNSMGGGAGGFASVVNGGNVTLAVRTNGTQNNLYLRGVC
jgi:hypothetical protein